MEKVVISQIIGKRHFLVESKCKYSLFSPDQTIYRISTFGSFITALLCSWESGLLLVAIARWRFTAVTAIAIYAGSQFRNFGF